MPGPARHSRYNGEQDIVSALRGLLVNRLIIYSRASVCLPPGEVCVSPLLDRGSGENRSFAAKQT